MQNNHQIRLKLDVLKKALTALDAALAIKFPENDIALDATIQRFEFCYELFWKTLKKILFDFEKIEALSPKQVLQQCYALGWLSDETFWLKMLEDRNLTSHTYQEKLALEIYSRVPEYAKKMRDVTDFLIKTYVN